jgi:hypothetical protein
MRYRPAHAEQRIPMPDRGPGVLFTHDRGGESIDPLNPYFARMIADGDLVLAEEAVEDDGPVKIEEGQ